jgi:hypothetical protein
MIGLDRGFAPAKLLTPGSKRDASKAAIAVVDCNPPPRLPSRCGRRCDEDCETNGDIPEPHETH